GVELEQVESIGVELLEAVLDVFAEVFLAVALVGFAVRAGGPGSSGGGRLGGDVEAVAIAALVEDFGDDAFAAAVAVASGGVDEIDARVDGGMEGGDGLVVVLWPPSAADGPAAEA